MRKHINFQPLIVEEHPEDYKGYEFITLIRYNNQNYLTIIDNITDDQIVAYVLDYCENSNIDEKTIINVANQWYENSKDMYPLSIEYSKAGLGQEVSQLIRCFSVDFVTRVIGPIYKFNMKGPDKIRRRKRKAIPASMTFVDKTKS